VTLVAQRLNRHTHQVHCAQRMMETGMQRPRINQVGHTQLFNITQSLEIWVLNQIKYQFGWDTDKTVNRVVNDLLFIQGVVMRAKMLNKGNNPVVYLLIFVNA